MKLLNKGMMLLALAFTYPMTSFAAEPAASSPAKINAWKHCGIGAMIFDDNPQAAAISNIIWDSGTTALTSATASEDTCDSKELATALYILETYSNLEEETAKGQGQHMTAMLSMMGCESASHSHIIGSVRNEFAKSMNDASASNQSVLSKAEKFHNLVKNQIDSQYPAQCQVI